MRYKTLKSLSYGENEDYVREYKSRLESEDAVKLDFCIGKNPAFFLQNSEVMTLAYRIAKLDEEIYKLCDQLPGVALNQYSRKCLIDEIVLTNKIEGVHSSRKEIGEALDLLDSQSSAKKGERKRFMSLVKKYVKLTTGEDIPLHSCEDVRELYDEVFLQEVIREDSTNEPDGKLFRKNSVSVYTPAGKEIHNGVYPEKKILECMDKALSFLNDESVEELFRVCVFHYLIEYIHPFYDGNGRLGRLILSYGISRTQMPLVACRISETIKEHINDYYGAFKTCNDQRNLGDVTPFLIMQLTMIELAMKELKDSLEKKWITWGKYEKAVQEYYGDDQMLQKLYSVLIQAALFSEIGITMRELTAHMECSKYKVQQYMARILPEWIVTKKKDHSNFYCIDIVALNELIVHKSMEALQDKEQGSNNA